jgi:uncharacterized membrane protein
VITTWQNSDDREVRILAKGNFSLRAEGLVNLLAALALVTLSLAGVLAVQGYWPIMMIAVAQIVLVTWILVRAWKRAWVSEAIEISPDRILILRQRHRLKRRIELATAWAVVELIKPEVAWYGPKLILRSGGESVELGAFLTTEEKHQLAIQLKKAVKKHSAL